MSNDTTPGVQENAVGAIFEKYAGWDSIVEITAKRNTDDSWDMSVVDEIPNVPKGRVERRANESVVDGAVEITAKRNADDSWDITARRKVREPAA